MIRLPYGGLFVYETILFYYSLTTRLSATPQEGNKLHSNLSNDFLKISGFAH